MSKKITELTAASTIQDEDSFVLEQEGQAMRLPGGVLRKYAEDNARTVAEDVWKNLPGVADIEVVEKSTEHTVDITYTDGVTEKMVITRDENDYPVQITTNGRVINCVWSVSNE